MFAILVHENQYRKGSQIPYILHPLETGIITSKIKYDTDLIGAALLHDTIEDAKITHDALTLMFNKRIADLVSAVSEDKSKGWHDRKQHTIDYLNHTANEDVKIITLADKLANIREIHKDYAEIGDALWQIFNVKDKKEHKWYYEALVSSLKRYEAYCEFGRLVGEVFGGEISQ